MLALLHGEVLWRWLHFVFGARGSLGGILGRMCNVGIRVSKIDYIRGARGVIGARRGGQRAKRAESDRWGAVWQIQER